MAGASEPLTLLVVSGGREALPIITAARGLGFRVLVSDGAPDAPGFRLADAGLVAGVCDAEATVAAARAYVTLNRIDGVIGVGPETAGTVDAVAAALRLPARMPVPLGDRLATAARLRAAGVPVPWSVPVAGSIALADLKSCGRGALALRPAGAGDPRATVRLAADADPSSAFAIAEAAASGGGVMVEAEADAPRVHALALVDAGRVAAAFFADRCDEVRGPLIVTRRLDFPSRRAGEDCGALLARAVAALDVRHGLVEADLVLTPDGPLVAGIAGCLARVHFATHQLPLATGLPIVEDVLCLALGRAFTSEARPRRARAAALRYLYAPAGTVMRISGVAHATADVALCELHVAPGDQVAALTPEPAGFVLADGDTLDEAIRRAEASAAYVRVLAVPPGRVVASHAVLH